MIARTKTDGINRIFGPPHVALKVGKNKANAILDTGADRTVISLDLFKHLFNDNESPKMQPSAVKLKGATGHKLDIVGQVNMPFTVAGISMTHPVQVIGNMANTFLIGNDLILDKVTIQKGRKILVDVNGKTGTAPIKYEIPQMRIHLTRAIDLAPNTVRLVEAYIKSEREIQTEHTATDPTLLLIESAAQLTDQFDFDPTLTRRLQGNKVRILISNTAPDPLSLDKDREIGTAKPVLPTDDPHVPYEEFQREGNICFLHDDELRDNIMEANPDGFNPIPAGYDQSSTNEPIEIEQALSEGLSTKERTRLLRILDRYRGVLSTGADDYGRTPLMSFSIETGDNKPVAARYRPIPASFEKEVRTAVKEMQTNDVIEEADSPWNSTLVLVRKPDGKLRICVNLKGVNEVTTNQTSYPINQQEQSLARLCNGKHFFRLDLSQAYYAIPLATHEDRDRTAFSAFGKQFRFKVSPFGARYLPSRFNKLMTEVLGGLDHYLFYYFDDVIGCFQTADELLDGLATVLQRLIAANLRVNFKKSEFSLTSLNRIKWLGSVIQDNKIWPDSMKLKAIADMPIPTNKHGLMRFLGAVNYHRRHIENMAAQTAPLSKLVSPKAAFTMGPTQIEAFDKLKKLITSAPALALPDTTKAFIITTDASDIGVGGVLSQLDKKGEEQIVAYCSRTLSVNEQNGSSCEKEILAILYGVSVFYFYIANAHFTLRSDSKSLVFLRHFKELNSKLFRASLILDELSFDIQHLSATRSNMMGVADMISRAYGDAAPDPPRASYKTLREPRFEKITAPPNMPKQPIGRQEFDKRADKYLKKFISEQEPAMTRHDLISFDAVAPRDDGLEGLMTASTRPTTATPTPTKEQDTEALKRIALRPNVLTPELFRKAQRDDEKLKEMIAAIENDPAKETETIYLKNRILCRTTKQQSGLYRTTVIVPKTLQREVLDFYHGAPQGAHRGRKQLHATIQQLFYWKGMTNDIRKYAQECTVCKYQSPDTNPQVTLGRHTSPQAANETINIDIVGPFKQANNQMKFILTVQCDFTKYVLAFPLHNKSAEIIAKTVMEHWVAPFGPPKFIRSDEGTDCDSALMQYVCRAMGIRKIRTPIYSPQANPIERWHATLGKAMRAWLEESQYKEWPSVVPFIAHSYNTSVNTTTKLTPQQLFFGRDTENHLIPIMPDDHPAINRHRYLKQIQRAQHIFWEIARRNLREKQKASLPVPKRNIRPYVIGDHILIRNQAKAHKLDDKWLGPYRIIEVKPNALHCVKWDTETQEEYRLHHHADDMGTLVKKIVHPKDATLWTFEMPSGPKWDDDFAKRLFAGINKDYNPSEWAHASENQEAQSETTSVDDTSSTAHTTSTAHPYSPVGSRASSTQSGHSRQTTSSTNSTSRPANTPRDTSTASSASFTSAKSGKSTESDTQVIDTSGEILENTPNMKRPQAKQRKQQAESPVTTDDERDSENEVAQNSQEQEEDTQSELIWDYFDDDSSSDEVETAAIGTGMSPDDTNESIAPNDRTHYVTQPNDKPSFDPYERFVNSEFAAWAPQKYSDALDRLERRYKTAYTKYEREGHPSGKPPPELYDPVYTAKQKFPSTSTNRSAENEVRQRNYFTGNAATNDVFQALKAQRQYDTHVPSPMKKVPRYTRATAHTIEPEKKTKVTVQLNALEDIEDIGKRSAETRTNMHEYANKANSFAGLPSETETTRTEKRPATIAGGETTTAEEQQQESRHAVTATPPPFNVETRTIRPGPSLTEK